MKQNKPNHPATPWSHKGQGGRLYQDSQLSTPSTTAGPHGAQTPPRPGLSPRRLSRQAWARRFNTQLYLAACTHDRAAVRYVYTRGARIAALREFWTDWPPWHGNTVLTTKRRAHIPGAYSYEHFAYTTLKVHAAFPFYVVLICKLLIIPYYLKLYMQNAQPRGERFSPQRRDFLLRRVLCALLCLQSVHRLRMVA